MKLQEFMNKNTLSYREMGALAGVNHTTIFYYVQGKKRPTLEVAYKIELATKKKVKMVDLLDTDTRTEIEDEFKA